MNTDKDKYLAALKGNNGQLDEVTLGQTIGLTNEQTEKIINELEDEGKIEFQSFGVCSY
jgi:hypothetical protein